MAGRFQQWIDFSIAGASVVHQRAEWSQKVFVDKSGAHRPCFVVLAKGKPAEEN